MIPRAMILLTLLLAACTPTQTLKGSGRPADPPAGYVTACEKNPALENCKP